MTANPMNLLALAGVIVAVLFLLLLLALGWLVWLGGGDPRARDD